MTNQLDPQKNIEFKFRNRSFDPDRRTLLNVEIRTDDESERLDHGMSERVCRRIDRSSIFWVHYGENVFTLIVLILIFSLLDAFFTLVLIDYGATELNPLMSFYLNIGPTTFISVKYGMTSLSIFVLLVCSHNPTKKLKIKTQSLFFTILLAVAGVLSWQLYLFCLIVF